MYFITYCHDTKKLCFFRYRRDSTIIYKNSHYDEVNNLKTQLDQKVCNPQLVFYWFYYKFYAEQLGLYVTFVSFFKHFPIIKRFTYIPVVIKNTRLIMNGNYLVRNYLIGCGKWTESSRINNWIIILRFVKHFVFLDFCKCYRRLFYLFLLMELNNEYGKYLFF